MIKKYKTRWGRISVETFEKETDCFLVGANGRRTSKRSSWENYFDSWDEAKQFLLDEAQQKLDMCRRSLADAQSKFGNIKGMKPPADEKGRG